jgi:hypothetical protein
MLVIVRVILLLYWRRGAPSYECMRMRICMLRILYCYSTIINYDVNNSMHACKGSARRASWSRRGLFERIVAEVPGGVTSSSPMNGMPTIIILCEPHLSQVELVPRWLSAVELRERERLMKERGREREFL